MKPQVMAAASDTGGANLHQFVGSQIPHEPWPPDGQNGHESETDGSGGLPAAYQRPRSAALQALRAPGGNKTGDGGLRSRLHQHGAAPGAAQAAAHQAP